MPINDAYKANFDTLHRAARDNNIALLECTDAATGKPVMTVCAVQRTSEGYSMVPLAKLFDGNPYEELMPPTEPGSLN